jgi:hypothetical protein
MTSCLALPSQQSHQPWISMIFSGFRQDRLAAATHDDLYVRSLTILNENITIALVSLERIGFFRPEFMEKIRRILFKRLPPIFSEFNNQNYITDYLQANLLVPVSYCIILLFLIPELGIPCPKLMTCIILNPARS